MRPRLLDLFCGAGGAAMGYHRAGFEVIGVDIHPQPNYPFEFHQGDALTDPRALHHWFDGFDAIHASPPCQASSALTKGTNRATKNGNHVDLIGVTREMLLATGKRFVIENVQGAKLRRDLTLCGEMFGLGVIRHRIFECGGFRPLRLAHVPHRGRVAGWRHGQRHDGPYVAVYGAGGGTVTEWQEAMGIDWMTRSELAEAIPPAYTEFIGSQLMPHIGGTP